MANPTSRQSDTPRQTNEEKSPGKKRRRGKSLLFRVLSFILMAVLVLGAVVLVVYRDELNIDALRRAIAYRSVERNDVGQSTEFEYEENSSNRFSAYQGGLLVASTTNIKLFAQSGTILFSENILMSNPALCAAERHALVYDIGGSQLVAFTDQQVSLALKLEDDLSIFSAQLNDEGWIAATTQESGYKGVVSVYNGDHALSYRWNSSSQFVTDAVVLNDCQTMVAVSIGQDTTQYQSTLSFFRLDSEDVYATLDLGDRVVLSVTVAGDAVCVLTDNALLYVDASGALIGEYAYSNQYLRGFSDGGDGFTVLHLSKYQAGSLGQLVTVDPTGEAIASFHLAEDVLSISSAGRYIAILFADRLEIYNSDLEQYARLDGTNHTRSVLMRSDGSVLCVGSGTAWLYIPE